MVSKIFTTMYAPEEWDSKMDARYMAFFDSFEEVAQYEVKEVQHTREYDPDSPYYLQELIDRCLRDR